MLRQLERHRVGWGDFLADTSGGIFGAKQWAQIAACKELSTRNPLITLSVCWSDVRWTDGASESQTNAQPIMDSLDRLQLPVHRDMEPDRQPCKQHLISTHRNLESQVSPKPAHINGGKEVEFVRTDRALSDCRFHEETTTSAGTKLGTIWQQPR